MFEQILEDKYEDYEIDKKDLTLRTQSALKLFKSTVSGNEPYQIENTQTQSESDEWQRSRFLHITVSAAKDISNVKTTRGKYSLLRRLLWGRELPDLKTLRYGRTNESKAFQQYSETVNENQTVETTGLWINPKFPELGCSPDGILKTDGKSTSVIEIKCLFILECIHPCE
ncbi:hypothetical protein DPMN_187991 [Dreissena polymorpha]|uniref:YqaJ viral recombinase domain-containing protein n=1 Tax=Dreissena polymorpha TaxID=45954 RepID=A0A9D4I822_DREPO|nr:hypothetical protein DPMN_187991 [Dreissena polymorpha]